MEPSARSAARAARDRQRDPRSRRVPRVGRGVEAPQRARGRTGVDERVQREHRARVRVQRPCEPRPHPGGGVEQVGRGDEATRAVVGAHHEHAAIRQERGRVIHPRTREGPNHSPLPGARVEDLRRTEWRLAEVLAERVDAAKAPCYEHATVGEQRGGVAHASGAHGRHVGPAVGGRVVDTRHVGAQDLARHETGHAAAHHQDATVGERDRRCARKPSATRQPRARAPAAGAGIQDLDRRQQARGALAAHHHQLAAAAQRHRVVGARGGEDGAGEPVTHGLRARRCRGRAQRTEHQPHSAVGPRHPGAQPPPTPNDTRLHDHDGCHAATASRRSASKLL
jgi:hypothetical protein